MEWKDLLKQVAPLISTSLKGNLYSVGIEAISDVLFKNSSATEADIKEYVEKNTSFNVLQKFKKAEDNFSGIVKDLGIDINDVNSARNKEIALKDKTPQVLAYLYTIGYFFTIGFVLVYGVRIDSKDLVYTLLGAMSAAQVAIVSYYYGSSHGSSEKNSLIKDLKK